MSKAIILAVGQGTRLRPLTDDCPKCMVKYREVPLIEQIVGTMRECGIGEIVLVTGYKAEALAYLNLKRYHNPRFASTNMVASLFCAERELDTDVIISYSDIIYRPKVLNALLECRDECAVVIDKRWRELWETRMDDPLEDAETMKLSSDGYIEELGKKASSYDEIQGQYIGLIKLSAHALKKNMCVLSLSRSMRALRR